MTSRSKRSVRSPRWRHRVAAAVGAAFPALSACATVAHFRDESIVWRTREQSIAEPAEREFSIGRYVSEIMLLRRLPRALELHGSTPAENTNALDEVPDSSWFENRIGVRRVSPEEAGRGPVVDGPPMLPLTIVGGKAGGGNAGFTVEDARGLRYLVKFDRRENPEMQTGTSVLVNRIFWTLGFHVPEDTVFELARGDLLIGEDATLEDELGDDVPITRSAIDDVLVLSPRLPDGRFRASASRFLDGVPKGGFAAEGTRADDPNDVVPHEHRRELRAMRVFGAWTNHTDMKEDNTIDMYVTLPDGRRVLRHYLLDFGEALGAHAAEKLRYEDGYEHVWDWQRNVLATMALGLWVRQWEHLRETPWPAVGAFSGAHFDPERWRPAYPWWPIFEADAADLYWGAKLVALFDRPMLEAIVAEARFSDPAAARYLVDALLTRRRRIVEAWLEAVTPLDFFEMEGRRLCMVDVGILSGVARQGVVEMLPARYDPDFDDGDELHERALAEYTIPRSGRVCVPIDRVDSAFVRLRVRRGRFRKPVMQVHYRTDGSDRVVGVVRVES